MSNRKKDWCNIILIGCLLAAGLIACLFHPQKEVSVSERRTLHSFPELGLETIYTARGTESFMDRFEPYVADQFPCREQFRTLYSAFSLYALQKKEVNDIYYAEDHILKTDPEIRENSVSWALNRMKYIDEKYLQNSHVYFSIIPDKNDYLSEHEQVPYLDFDAFEAGFREKTDAFSEYIDLTDELELDDYYRTDLHWRQEKILPVVNKLELAMGNYEEKPGKAKTGNGYLYGQFEEKEADVPFYGVYYGQGALPVAPDKLSYLYAGYMDGCVVTCYDTGKAEAMPMYDESALKGMDPYELFLSGSRALITIENPDCGNDRELVLFRDSFGSSIAPLLAQAYCKVTLVDIRYIRSDVLGRFVDFDGADVLFLYSTQVLNHCDGQFLQ